MCGILGIAKLNASASPVIDETRARACLKTLSHRGPDDEGIWWSDDRSVMLGHRRLSIIDLSEAGHQPMTNEDGSVWIIYNGEVYNFKELREELERKGHRFRSRTDTEVIVHGYEEYGPGIVERLRGMFAFAIYDTRRERLLLARDRIGIKPLYYTWTSSGALGLASEIKPLLELPGVEKKLNGAALREYLSFGKVYAPNTMFEGIEKFPAAHYAIVTASGMKLERYWSPYERKLDLPSDAGEEWYASRLLAMLEESVSLRMVSDVPVGVFLSGGVDSTANVALMSRVSGERIHTFTAGFQGQDAFDERSVARAAARQYNTLHDEIEITERDLRAELPHLAYYLDEPVADATVIPIFFLSKLAREKGAVVILNGDGGDELFCGYRKYMQFLKLAPYWKLLKGLPGWTRSLAASVGHGIGVRGVAADLLDRAARDVEMYVGSTGSLKGTDLFREIVGNGAGGHREGNSSDGIYRAVREAHASFMRERRSDDYAEWLSYWGVRSEVENVFLYRADRMGMANSVEIRVPLLDHHLVELAMQMPQELKYRHGETKYILKKALEPVVPREFLYRKKQGFCVPLREWSGAMMESRINETLPRMSDDWGVISGRFVESVTGMLRDGERSDREGALSWMLYNLSVWYERWFR